MTLRFAAAAEVELLSAAEWYDKERSGLGSQFLDACARVLRQIEEQPDRYTRLETVQSRREIRRCVLKRFAYAIIYEVTAEEAVVLAVAHVGRRPNYWIQRK